MDSEGPLGKVRYKCLPIAQEAYYRFVTEPVIGYWSICILSTTTSGITFVLPDQTNPKNLTDNPGPWIFVAFTAHPHDSKSFISSGAHCTESAKESEVTNTSSL